MTIRLILSAAALATLCTAAPAKPAKAKADAPAQALTPRYAIMDEAPLDAARWTGGFWGERFDILSHRSLQSMWQTWQSKEGKGFNNFLIAAGEKKGEHHGPPFHDGDMYKWLEAVAAVYAVNRDPELLKIMDRFVALVCKAQRADGYIHTPVIIAERNKGIDTHAALEDNKTVGTAVGTGADGAFGNRLNFETYNLGHLMTAGTIHYRATGDTRLLEAGRRAADFLARFCDRAADELARNAICPSHYMGVADMYRQTKDPKYLSLEKKLIDIRGQVEHGTDDNQDRHPFRQQYQAMGHAVRANYLYAGAADYYLDQGEAQIKANLDSIWRDITTRKMYITGACGALYDGTSPDGTNYTPDSIQKVHQSYGRPYQLPHSTAHNETCANIGNMMFAWRMFRATGDGQYTDVVERCLYNSILPGISLDGERYFYVNPMRLTAALPYKLRWPKERQKYISCFCCPPNTLRTLAEAQHYIYTTSDRCLWVNLYGASELTTAVAGAGTITLRQETDYPWDGRVMLTLAAMKGKRQMTLRLRIPAWCTDWAVEVNGEKLATAAADKGYVAIDRLWRKGDQVALRLDMPARLTEANPLVEESRGQIAVERGPIVYCLESTDTKGAPLDEIMIPADAQFRPVETEIAGARLFQLETEAVRRAEPDWSGQLYRTLGGQKSKASIRLTPYYAWGNRGKADMTVWMPVMEN